MESLTCDPSIYTMDHPNFTVCGFMENSISQKRLKAPTISHDMAPEFNNNTLIAYILSFNIHTKAALMAQITITIGQGQYL